MTKSPEQKRARKLQDATGWSYVECLRIARLDMWPEKLSELCQDRGLNISADFLVENYIVRKVT